MSRTGKAFRAVTALVLSVVMMVPGFVPFTYTYADDETKTGNAAGNGKVRSLNSILSEKPEEKKYADDSVIVMFKDDVKFSKKRAKKILTAGEEAVEDIEVEEVWTFDKDENDSDDITNVALVSADSMSGNKLVKALEKRSDVKYAERNSVVRMFKVSDDEYSDLQWSMQDEATQEFAPNVGFEWNTKKVTGNEDKIVAVVDTGVDYTHPDLKDNMWKNTHYPKLKGNCGYDFSAGDTDPMDENGHGTHCAGIIGATGNNGIGISGVNQKIKIMALRILDAEGSAMLAHEIAAYNYINDALDLGEPVVAINNSWGGGEPSDIMEELVDIVGEKGAVTVCAAGNEGISLDEYEVFPASIDSNYLISVAASTRAGKLTSFSNYGKEVDVAAPGADILSSVSYDSYLPTIYDDIKQAQVSEKYNDFEDDSNTWGEMSEDTLYIDGVKYSEMAADNKPEVTFSKKDGNVLEDSGKHLEVTLKGLTDGMLVCMPIRYTIEEDRVSDPHLSLTASVDGPEEGGFFGSSLFGVIEESGDKEPTMNDLGYSAFQGSEVYGESDFWRHTDAHVSSYAAPEAGDERQFIVTLYAYAGGDYTIRLDDIGLSKQSVEESEFGKYDIYSGTSMACPYVTGSVALKYAEKDAEAAAGEKTDPLDVIAEVTQMTKLTDPELKTASGGIMNFTKVPEQLAPKIGRVTVDVDADEIKITGVGMDPKGTDLKVEIGESVDKLKTAEIKEKTARYVTVKNDGWINNIETIKVTGFGPKPAVKEGVFLVKGKKEYTEKPDYDGLLEGDAFTTDGKNIYVASSRNKEITRFDTSQKELEPETVGTVDVDAIYKIEKDKKKQYALLFGDDLIYANGFIYNVAEYGAADEKEPTFDDDGWFFSKGKKDLYDDEDYEGEDDVIDGEYSIYSGEKHLLAFKASDTDGQAIDLGALPEELVTSEDYTLAAYNGKIYAIGGHNYAGGDDKMIAGMSMYDPKTGKWTESSMLPALTEPRAKGKALQYQDKLIYTLSEGEKDNKSASEYDIFIFDGKAWTKKVPDKLPERYWVDDDWHDISLVKSGILFTGGAVADYGDTFIYDVSENKFKDTGYNYIEAYDDAQIDAVAIGDTLYGFDRVERSAFTIPVESGFVRITTAATGKGKVTGTGWVAPGNDATVTIKASKNNHIKSIKVGSKSIKVKKNAKSQTVTINQPMTDQKVTATFEKDKQVKVTVKKTGKGKVTGAKKYYVGKNAKITAKAAKGYYIKSFKVGTKNVKIKGKPAKKTYTIKKIKKNTKVKVVFAKK